MFYVRVAIDPITNIFFISKTGFSDIQKNKLSQCFKEYTKQSFIIHTKYYISQQFQLQTIPLITALEREIPDNASGQFYATLLISYSMLNDE
jgi:hypothetical protein